MKIDATGMHFQELGRRIKEANTPVTVSGCNGQRYLANGAERIDLTIHGTPGNALGAYLESGSITVMGNAQEATGDTMNGGRIVIHGNAGDGTGYAMRGGELFVRGSTSYRAGVHMKEYGDRIPVMVIGGRAGNFLGEYQAGGRIIVLGLHEDGKPVVGDYCGTGIHRGSIYIRSACLPKHLPRQVLAQPATDADKAEIRSDVEAFCRQFVMDADALLADSFFVLRPDKANPYRQMYTHN